MFDTSLLFHNAEVLSTSGNSSNVEIRKTPADGVWVEIVVTAYSGTSPTLDLIIQDSDDGSSFTNIRTVPQITTTGRWYFLVQSKKRYLRLNRTIGGTGSPSFTVTAGVSSGPQRDITA